MTTTKPIPFAAGALAYHTGSSKLVLLDLGNYPASQRYQCNTYTFNGSDWSLTIPASAATPTARGDGAIAFDGTNVMLFGGKGVPGSQFLGDTWTYNGSAWTLQLPTTSPSVRSHMMMASITGGVVMFGGKDMVFMKNETWTWNGSNWIAQTPTISPSVRIKSSFAGNGTTTAILFGGEGQNACLNDTWSYSASSNQWTLLTTNTPPSIREGAAMCFDASQSNYVMFGGKNQTTLLPETWVFDGVSTWSLKSPNVSPPARTNATIAYDTASAQVIMIGGEDNWGNKMNDTWQWVSSSNTWIAL